MVTIDGIPVFNAVIEGDDDGMMRVSLVDAPAVMSDFQKFGKDRQVQMFSVKDEDKRLVYGVLMRADFPIYRYDSNGEYYIIYKADTIRKMAEKYLRENRQNNVNIMHGEHSDVNGVQMVQMFIKDSEKGVAPVGFDDIADGSLFAEYHITNDEVWGAIKDGTYKGFSLEGYFVLVAEQDGNYIDDVVSILDGKFSRIYDKLSKEGKMSTLKKIKEALAKALVECGSMTTDKGVISWEGDEDIKVGDKVSIVTNDEEGNEVKTPAEDGEYIADGMKYIVKDGAVAEIVEVENDDKGNEAEGGEGNEGKQENEAFEASKQNHAEDTEGDEGNEDVAKLREDIDALRKEMDEAYKLIDKLLEVAGLTRDEADAESNLSKMGKEIADIKASVEAMRNEPSAHPASVEIENPHKAPKECRSAKFAEAIRK